MLIIYCITTTLYGQFYLVHVFVFLFFCFFLVIFNLTLVHAVSFINLSVSSPLDAYKLFLSPTAPICTLRLKILDLF